MSLDFETGFAILHQCSVQLHYANTFYGFFFRTDLSLRNYF